ncbi:UNVERIFIED_CONTAM: hypothetical protein Sradi_0562800 [Sesamum radiatum]|uniref:Uncharacterized protein n=1 Tax=Sesamum radiatum TaxID=300843 RepID=A0AAW2VJF1_SESRA
MEDEKEGDIRVPLVFSFFCLCVTAGGAFLIFYVFVPSSSRPWYPVAAFILIGSPWIFWLLTYLYSCIKGYRRAAAPADVRQISRRQTTMNTTSAAMQSSRRGGGADPYVGSSKEPEMPLTSSV